MKRAIVAVALLAGCGGTDAPPAQTQDCAPVATFDHYFATQGPDQTTIEVVFAAPFPTTTYDVGLVATGWTGTSAIPALYLGPTALDRQKDRVRLVFPTAPGPGVTVTWDVAVACTH